MRNSFGVKKIFFTKYMALALVTVLLFFVSHFNLLEKYFSYGKARIVVAAEFSDQSTPMFTLGYLDILKLSINESISNAGFLCRSIDLKISTHKFQSIHDIEMYCQSNPFSQTSAGRSLDKIVEEKLMEWQENKIVTIKYMNFVENEENFNLKILISLLYVLILIVSLPWYPFIKRK